MSGTVLVEVVGDLLPAALAIALSPIPVIAVVLVLGSPRGRSNGPAFAAGWIVGLASVSVVVVVLARGAEEADGSGGAVVDGARVAIGIACWVLAAKQWRKRPGGGDLVELPAWMAGVETLTAARAGLLGLALSAANPKNLALVLAASSSIAAAALEGGDTAIAVAVLVLVGSSSVAGAVVWFLVDADRAAGRLDTVKHFMTAHNAAIMTVVLVLLGAKVLGEGLAGLQA